MNFREITERYYSRWAGCDPADISSGRVLFISNPEREYAQHGYSRAFPLYVLKTTESILISYAKGLQPEMDQLKSQLRDPGIGNEELKSILEQTMGAPIGHALKFVFTRSRDIDPLGTVSLGAADFDLYRSFYFRCNPDQNPNKTEWLHEYFLDISAKGYCIARMADGHVASATDAPSMPYLSDEVQEIGISTLPEYRRKGYARQAVSACIEKVLLGGKCPLWSCRGDNTASEGLAYSVGFEKFADLFTCFLA